MKDRRQYVRIGSEHSTLCGLSHGVPQGSILGPVLFNIYINDLPTLPESCTLESYVDDSKLFLSFQVKDSLDVATQVNDDLKRVAYWCSQNSLLINPTKTKVLVVGTRQMFQRVPSDFKLVQRPWFICGVYPKFRRTHYNYCILLHGKLSSD